MNIIVTGASKGIGKALCEYFGDKDYNIIAISRNEELLNELSKNYPNITSFPIDVCSDNLKKELSEIPFEKIDILINNAGALVNKPFMDTSSEDWAQMLNINLMGTVNMCKALMPKLKMADKSHVVNIGSMGGHRESKKFVGLAAYSTAKGAIATLTECLAEEFHEDGVSFNCLELGAVQTEMLETAFPGYRSPISAEKIAKYIGNFAETAHEYMNGKCVPVSLINP
ncbi:MAG: 3-oxoacyl-[acyl-carrier protein] reductase [Sphingobacteriales bacterium]|jgi:3-oxoacyl-[acyl-carrier protein] reductase